MLHICYDALAVDTHIHKYTVYFVSISASIYAATYARPSFTRHLHICYYIVFKNSICAKSVGSTMLHICYDALAVDTRIQEYTVHYFTSIAASIYAATYARPSFTRHLHICQHAVF